MRISQRQFGIARVLDLHGPLVGLAAAELVGQVLDGLPPRPWVLVVNLTRVPEIDDHGILVLRTAARTVRRHGGTMRLAQRGDVPLPVAPRLRVDVDSFATVEDALVDVRAALGQTSPWMRWLKGWPGRTRWFDRMFW